MPMGLGGMGMGAQVTQMTGLTEGDRTCVVNVQDFVAEFLRLTDLTPDALLQELEGVPKNDVTLALRGVAVKGAMGRAREGIEKKVQRAIRQFFRGGEGVLYNDCVKDIFPMHPSMTDAGIGLAESEIRKFKATFTKRLLPVRRAADGDDSAKYLIHIVPPILDSSFNNHMTKLMRVVRRVALTSWGTDERPMPGAHLPRITMTANEFLTMDPKSKAYAEIYQPWRKYFGEMHRGKRVGGLSKSKTYLGVAALVAAMGDQWTNKSIADVMGTSDAAVHRYRKRCVREGYLEK